MPTILRAWTTTQRFLVVVSLVLSFLRLPWGRLAQTGSMMDLRLSQFAQTILRHHLKVRTQGKCFIGTSGEQVEPKSEKDHAIAQAKQRLAEPGAKKSSLRP